ncbi:hypothetical protein DV736_g6422, partial [Chaetothyriales sp. CBS 134916]
MPIRPGAHSRSLHIDSVDAFVGTDAMAQICLLDPARLSQVLQEALSWESWTSSLMVSASNGAILSYAFKGPTPSIKELRTMSTTMTAAYAIAPEDVLIFEAQVSRALSVIVPVGDHILLAVNGPARATSQEAGTLSEQAGRELVRQELEEVASRLTETLRPDLSGSNLAAPRLRSPAARLPVGSAQGSARAAIVLLVHAGALRPKIAPALKSICLLLPCSYCTTASCPDQVSKTLGVSFPNNRSLLHCLFAALALACLLHHSHPRYACASSEVNSGPMLYADEPPSVHGISTYYSPFAAPYHRPHDTLRKTGSRTYVLRDDMQLPPPPPHPSESPSANPNPLATSAAPPTAGVKLSLVSLQPKRIRPGLYKTNITTSSLLRWKSLGLNNSKEAKEPDRDESAAADSKSEGSQFGSADGSKNGSTPAFGETNAALSSVVGRDLLKRRKPKNNIIKSNSSFVSRVIPHEALAKKLAERDEGGAFAFVNINRAFQWLDLSSPAKADPMTKILFTKAHVICHDVNPLTKHATHMDVIMGSSASDIIWYEPISQKYARINKNGTINSTPVTKIRWIPGSENHFLASHMDGCLVVYDKEKEDTPFVSEESIDEGLGLDDDDYSTLNITKSVNSANQKANPVACWKLSNQAISDFAFSPDSRHLAVVAEDGYLRIIDYLQEKLTDVYCSYYGGFTCVTFSPDGKYALTGGQDDLISIWSMAERQIIARCPGHASWVTAVAFDPWRCDDNTYRFGSVGEDCKLLLWDFSVSMLNRPKGALGRTRGSVSAQSASLMRHRTESASIINRIRSDSNRSQSFKQPELDEDAEFINHNVEPQSRTAQLPPIMVKTIDKHPLCGIVFQEDCIITSCLEDDQVLMHSIRPYSDLEQAARSERESARSFWIKTVSSVDNDALVAITTKTIRPRDSWNRSNTESEQHFVSRVDVRFGYLPYAGANSNWLVRNQNLVSISKWPRQAQDTVPADQAIFSPTLSPHVCIVFFLDIGSTMRSDQSTSKSTFAWSREESLRLRLGPICSGARPPDGLPKAGVLRIRAKHPLQQSFSSTTATVATYEQVTALAGELPVSATGLPASPTLARVRQTADPRPIPDPVPARLPASGESPLGQIGTVEPVVSSVSFAFPLGRFRSLVFILDNVCRLITMAFSLNVLSPASAMALKFLGNHSGSSANSAVKHFDIRLDNDYIVFRGSEDEAACAQLAGSLVLCLTEPLNVSHIQLTLSGIVHMSWSSSSTTHMSSRKVCFKEKTFFEKTWPFMVPGKTKTEVLLPDNYEWPFDTILEGALPESIEGLKDAWIIYRLKAEIGRKRGRDIVARKPLRIVRTLDPSALELAHAMSVDNIWPNKIEYSISVPSKAIVFGSFVRVDFKLISLLKGLVIGNITTEVREEQELVVDPEWGVTSLAGSQSRLERVIAQDVYTLDPDKDEQVLDEEAEGYQFSRFLELPKTLNRYQSPQAGRAAMENDMAHAAPPVYGEHILDKLYSELDPSGYLTPGMAMSTPGTPCLQSRQQSHENLRSLDAITSSGSAHSSPSLSFVSPLALQYRLQNLHVGNQASPSQLPTDDSDESGRPSDPHTPNDDYLPHGSHHIWGIDGQTEASSSAVSRRPSGEDDGYTSGARTPFPQFAHMEDLSRVPSYTTAVKAGVPRRQVEDGSIALPTYGAAVTTAIPAPLAEPQVAHVRGGANAARSTCLADAPPASVASQGIRHSTYFGSVLLDEERRLRILQARGR